MPVTCRLMDNKYRICEESSGNVSTTEKGNPVDGGGHKTHEKCMSQARAINAHLAKKGKI